MNPSLFLFYILSFVLLFLSLPFPSLSEKCHPNDKKALLQIKKALGNPDTTGTWDPKTDCCTDWSTYTMRCDEKTNRVTSINLKNIENAGYISPAVGDLPYLTDINFLNNPKLSGPIPSTIIKLSKLKSLTISITNVSGPVPGFLGKLKTLTYLSLSRNQLEGTIPPSLSELTNLEYLRLDRNKLTGTIPESFGKLAKKTTYLYLGHNKLTGVVPKSFAGWSFDILELSRNMLEGDISFLFGKDKNTFEMLLDRNMFEFDFSKVTFGKRLGILDLNHNKIYGSLPNAMIKQPWQLFNVSFNSLCGKIPQGGKLATGDFDQYDFLHNKCLCGSPLSPCK